MAKKKKKRLNVKFLVILSSAAVVALTLAVIAGYLYKQSPGRAVRRAQEAQQNQDWETAAEQWGKAARYSGNDPDYSLKAIGASMHLTKNEDGGDILKQIMGGYSSVLASEPDNLEALRGQTRLYVGSGRLDSPSADGPTREVRRLAGEILRIEPNDAEAKTLQAVATLNLANFAGEGVSPDQADRAREDLREVVLRDPLDGLGLTTLALDRLRKADQARRDRDGAAALAGWQEAVQLVDEVAAKAGDLGPDADLDAIDLRHRIGDLYRVAAQSKPLFDAAQLVQDGQAVTADQLRELADDPLTTATAEKGEAALAAAAAALDDERDALNDVYLDTMASYAKATQQRGDNDEAEAAFRRLSQARPWDPAAAILLARFLQQRGQVEGAVTALREQQARADEPLPDLTGYAGLIVRQNQVAVPPRLADLLLDRRRQVADAGQKEQLLQEAASQFETFESTRRARGLGESAETTRIRGELQLAQGDAVAAIQTLNSALRQTEGANSSDDLNERLRALALLVEANRQRGQAGPVQRNLEEMIRINPNVVALRAQLADSYLSTGDAEKARPLIDALVAAEPQNPSYQQLQMRATPADERAASYAALPESTPAERRVKLAAAARLDDSQEVSRLADAVLADSPDDLRLSLDVARLYANAGRKDDAIALVTPLAERDGRAKVLLALLRDDNAAAVEAMPEGVNKLIGEAQIASNNGDEAAALAKLEQARQQAPDNVAVANLLFETYARQEKLDAAATLVQRLKEQNADGMNGRSYDVRMSLVRGENERAAQEATALAADYPQLADALGLQGTALVRAGRPGDAVEVYRRALEVSPGNSTLLAGIITSLQQAGRSREVKPYIDAGLRANPDNAVYRSAAQAYELQYGDPQAVLSRREEAVEQSPDSAQAKIDLGQALLTAGIARREGEGGAEAQGYLSRAAAAYKDGLGQFPQDVRFLQGLVAAATRGGGELLAAAAPAVESATGGGALADNAAAAVAAAEFYSARQEPARAEDALRRALGAAGDAPRTQQAGLLLALSEVTARQGRIDDAVGVLGGYEDVPAVLERKINLLATRAAQNPADAAAYDALRKAVDAARRDGGALTPGALNAVGFAELQRGDLDRAGELFADSASRRPDDARTQFFQAAVEARKPGGDLNLAMDLLTRARAGNPQDADVLREMARVRRLRGQTDEAAAALAQLVDLQPANVAARLELLNLLTSANPPRTAEALRVFREAEAAGVAENPQLLLARAGLEELRGRGGDAVDYARQASEKAQGTPLDGQTLNIYLGLLLRQERPQVVLQRTQPLVAAAGSAQGSAEGAGAPWWVWRARGEALARLDRRPEAVDAYARAYRAGESLAGVAEQVLRQMAERLGFDAAYALLKDRVEPADGSAARPGDLVLASSLFSLDGQTQRAIDLLKQVDARTTEEGGQFSAAQKASIEAALGTLYLRSDPPQLDEAVAAFGSVLAVAPRDVATLNNMAYALSLQAERSQGEAASARRAEALDYGRRAYEGARAAAPAGQPANPSVTDTYASILATQAAAGGTAGGSGAALGEAVGLLRQARAAAEDADSAFPEVYLHLSQALRAQGDATAAEEAARAGLALLDRKRQAKAEVDADVERKLQTALAEATTAG